MTPISVLIVEDEILIAETIRIYLEERDHLVTEIAISYDEAIAAFERMKPDVVLLDVRLYGEKSGIDFAKFLLENHEDTPFIFLTSQFDRRIVENAMSTNPQGYLTKPIQKETLWTTTELAHHKFVLTIQNSETKIHLHDGSKAHIVNEDDIVFIKSEHVYLNINLEDGGKIIIRHSLSQILDQLRSEKFVQCHRSYIINTDHIKSYDSQELKFENDIIIPLSRSRKEDVMAMIKS